MRLGAPIQVIGEKPDVLSILRLDQPGRKDHILRPSRPNQRRQPRQVTQRKAVSKRARYWKSKLRIFRSNAQIAAGCNRRAAARASARYRCDSGHPASLERLKNAIHKGLIAKRVLRRLKIPEKGNIG